MDNHFHHAKQRCEEGTVAPIKSGRPTERKGSLYRAVRARQSLFGEFEQVLIAWMIAYGIEVGIVLEPQFHVASKLLQANLEQIDRAVDLGIPAALHQNVQHEAVLLDGPP